MAENAGKHDKDKITLPSDGNEDATPVEARQGTLRGTDRRTVYVSIGLACVALALVAVFATG